MSDNELEPAVREFEPGEDKLIAENVGVKTPREIALMLNADPKDVLRRASELLDQVDVLTISQQRQKLVMNLNLIAKDSLDAAKLTVDEYKAGLYNSAISAIEKIMKQMDRLKDEDDAQIEVLNRARIRELLRLVDKVIALGCVDIAHEYGIPEEALLGVFQARIVPAAAELENGA